MTALRLILAALTLAFGALIVWAVTAGDFSAAGAWLISDPWGMVTLADLYLGFVFLAAIIWIAERNKAIALLFILPLPFLGNVWAGIWVVWRLARLARRLHNAPE